MHAALASPPVHHHAQAVVDGLAAESARCADGLPAGPYLAASRAVGVSRVGLRHDGHLST